MTRFFTCLAGAVCWAAFATSARAGILWTATVDVPKPNILSDSHSNELLLSEPALFNGDGNATITVSQITVKLPFSGGTDNFTKQNYALDLTLTDVASSAFAVLRLSGDLTGTITAAGSSIVNLFTPEHTLHEVELGDHHYRVTLGPYLPGGTGADVGTIRALVEVRDPDGGQGPDPLPSVQDAPEPTTLVLACTAAGCTLLRSLRKRGGRPTIV